MTISQLTQEALELRDLAAQVLEYGMSNSLDEAWQRLEELLGQVRHVLAKPEDGWTLKGVSPSWDVVSKWANYVILACEAALIQRRNPYVIMEHD